MKKKIKFLGELSAGELSCNHFVTLAVAEAVNIFIVEAFGLITVTESYDNPKDLTLYIHASQQYK